jgi:exodeoxyribonuclease VIII
MKIIPYDQLTPELAAAGCLVSGMPNEAYHGGAGISKSGLDLIARSPAHYAFRAKGEPSRAMVIGSAIHAAILEPEVFTREYMLLTGELDRRSSAYKEAAKHYGADNVLTPSESDMVRGMHAAINACEPARALLGASGWAELAAFATDTLTGVLVKCKFDWLTADLKALDLKSTQDCRPAEFAKSVANYRYHVQASFYADVFKWATGLELESFDFLAVEKELPHAAKLYALDTAAEAYGRKLYREALNTYAACLASDNWPSINPELEYLGLPTWASDPEQQEIY